MQSRHEVRHARHVASGETKKITAELAESVI
jgi:hypothetical protein